MGDHDKEDHVNEYHIWGDHDNREHVWGDHVKEDHVWGDHVREITLGDMTQSLEMKPLHF